MATITTITTIMIVLLSTAVVVPYQISFNHHPYPDSSHLAYYDLGTLTQG